MNQFQTGGLFIGVVCALLLLSIESAVAQSNDSSVVADDQPHLNAIAGDKVSDVLVSLQHLGLPLLFSTNLVSQDFLVQDTVSERTKTDLARAVLAPHKLILSRRGDHFVVARAAKPKQSAPKNAIKEENQSSKLEQVFVTSSLYRLHRNVQASSFFVDQSKLELVPTLGEDTLRSLHRLPGVATQGISSQLRIRGSSVNDTSIYINGHRLSQPFHLRDFQSLFSTIDPRIADPIRAYTGGFPAEYGNTLQGLILVETLKPEEFPIREVGLSFFNSSFLYGNRLFDSSDAHWLVSARKGNLDWILNSRFGQPKYSDVFTELDVPLGQRTRLTFNGLFSKDEVFLSTETDPIEQETSTSDIDNNNVWIGVVHDWHDSIASRIVVAATSIQSRRAAVNNQVDKLNGQIFDARDIDKFQFSHQLDWQPSNNQQFVFGIEVARLKARFDYQAAAVYGDDYLSYQSITTDINRSAQLQFRDTTYSVYMSDKWQVNDLLSVDVGLRWDRIGYTNTERDSSAFSPRFALAYDFDYRSTITLSLGRYYQAQDIANLQIEDGQLNYHPAQRSDQYIVGLQNAYSDAVTIRLEAYANIINRVMPRYENLNDRLALVPELEPDRVLIAPEKGRTRGVELAVYIDGDSPWDAWFSYVWSRAEDRIDGTWRPRPWHQKHAFQAGISYENKGWSLSAALNAHSGWPTTSLQLDLDEDENESLSFGAYNGESLSTFASLDLRLSHKNYFGNNTLTTYVELTNASNRRNDCCVDFSLEEDNDRLFVEGTKEFGLPILPSIGFLWKF